MIPNENNKHIVKDSTIKSLYTFFSRRVSKHALSLPLVTLAIAASHILATARAPMGIWDDDDDEALLCIEHRSWFV